jgi:peptidylprolyl isomerase
VPTNQQRREAERRRLQRELEQRRAREISRRRMTLILSIVGTLVVIAAVIVVVVVNTGSDKKPAATGEKDTVSSAPATTSAPASTAPATTAAAIPTPTAPCAAAPKTATAVFKNLRITGATDLKHQPKVAGKSAAVPTALACEDLVVGKGAVAKTTSTATVQYVGALYNTGKVFQSSWGSGQTPSFSLKSGPQGVIPGFSQGIAGAGKVTPMRVGGRRLLILPPALAYGSQAQQGIPANSTLVFVVDLQKIAG